MNWESAARTEVGNVRKINEDAVLIQADGDLWAVADGMGGHQAGDRASKLVVQELSRVPRHFAKLSDYVNRVDDALQAVNASLCEISRREFNSRTIGTTVTCMIGYQTAVAYLWAGDSRVYRLRGNTLTQLNEDHSEVQRLVRAGFIKPEHAATHPSANVITHAVGASDELVLEVGIEPVLPGDVFLLCTDGLYREVSDDEICRTLQQYDVRTACDALVSLALSRAAADNLSVIVVRAKDGH